MPRFAILRGFKMLVLVAISVLSFMVLLGTSVIIARHIARVRRERARAVPAEPPRNLANHF